MDIKIVSQDGKEIETSSSPILSPQTTTGGANLDQKAIASANAGATDYTATLEQVEMEDVS